MAPLLLALLAFVAIGDTLSIAQNAAVARSSLGLLALVVGRGGAAG